ncbi:acyl-CoA/acyl-ACP dehydrogenase [Leptolyngbya sp. NK1-12]|uniref:Acyl-CoA/acyl-ACP dehydrogenase n=1 Tax=Leptolyngbya sp. NK1-12 TaxID=2547451 RepID=A0AA97AH61_9CYAN|nr:acyl-CoA dehydrogenase family protein [Leptolyngbya sp. NK1-12]WNZ25095.1 acyl-CoA/acyl-ACP dehydrogenase [Leptolyngbya sp. NK1-12]
MSSCLNQPLLLEQSVLDRAAAFLQTVVAPKAARLDTDPQALQQAFSELGEQQLLALRVAPEWQGTGVNELTFRTFQELTARYSGALAFLQTQHQSAAARLAQSNNESLKQKYLPYMATGQKRIGLGFSQLRRSGEAAVKATPSRDGYYVSGNVPWITGFGCFEQFILGAELPDGRALFGLVPLRDETVNGGWIALSQPLQLAAMASTNTVTAQLANWFLPVDQVLDLKPADWIHQSDRSNVLHHGFFALGCAQAGLDILAAAPAQSVITETLIALTQELETCRSAMYQAQAIGDTGMHQLDLRAWSIDLAVRCAHAAVAVSRGSANYANHPAQRVYREALAFTIFGQTTAVMEATLKRLTR